MRGSMVVLGAGLVLGAMVVAQRGIAGAKEALNLDGTAWTLSALPGHALLAGRPVTMRFENGRVHGTDGCNRYTAPYAASADSFQLSAPISSTKMACPGPAMTQAEAFLRALVNAHGARAEGAQLRLVDADGAVLATLDAQSQELTGTAWQVTAFNNGHQAVVSVLPGTRLTIEFSADGKLGGSAGCNSYTATYVSSRQDLILGNAAATRKTCAKPKGVMLQESLFFKALAMVTVARIDGDRLELRGRDGALVVSAIRGIGAAGVSSEAPTVLAGELSYMADAARFTDCASGVGYPVAMEADFVSMERAYLAAVKSPGANLYVTFEGTVAERPKIDGEGSEPTVVVSRFIGVQRDGRCDEKPK